MSRQKTDFLPECIADALIRLMRVIPFDKITINEIVSEAKVGRSTWFRSFPDKSAALTFKLVRLWERWVDERRIVVPDRYTLDNARDFFEFNYKYRDILKTIYSADHHIAVYNAFYQVMMPQLDSAAERYKARFYSYGLFGLLDEWVRGGFAESVEDMVEVVNKLSE